MLVQGVSFYRLVKWVDSACVALVFFTFFSSSAATVLIGRSKESALVGRVASAKACKRSFDYELIGKGALTIEEGMGNFALPNLKGEILFISKGSRPDQQEMCFLFGLKSSLEKRESVSGEKHYLTYGPEGELLFSDQPTPLSIVLDFVDEALRVEVALAIEADGQTVVDAATVFNAQMAGEELAARFLGEGVFGRPFVAMEMAHLLEEDKLFALYGGAEYASKTGCSRLLFRGEEDPSILYVKCGDTLLFQDGVWKPVYRNSLKSRASDEEQGQTENHSLAKILSISPHRVEVEVWDEKGLVKRKISISSKRSPSSTFRPSELFTQIRSRTATTVSLKIADRSGHLKRGDWLLKEGADWRLLDSWEKVEEYLKFEKRGELFVFDGVEKRDNCQIFCGHHFDTLREVFKEVQLPIAAKEKRSKKRPLPRAPSFPSMGEEEDEFDFDDEIPTPTKREGFAR